MLNAASSSVVYRARFVGQEASSDGHYPPTTDVEYRHLESLIWSSSLVDVYILILA